MASALLRKSITDLTRRKARSLFAISTLALAIASIGIFAVPSIVDRAMQAEVEAGRLPDLTVEMRPLALDREQLVRIAALPNVEAVEARSGFATRVYVGERRAKAIVVGVEDYTHQQVDVVHVASGEAPGHGDVATELQNARQDLYTAGIGDAARVLAADGSVRSFEITGEGRNLDLGQEVIFERWIVLYATPATVASLSGRPGATALVFRLEDASAAAVEGTIADVRRLLRAETGFTGFTDLPEVRPPGGWPGKEELEQFSSLLEIVTLLALLSALVLISNTMTTLVAEQTGEIGTMKAIGARRRQVAGVYARTALLLGGLGTAIGIALGILLANVLARFFGDAFFAIEPPFAVDAPVVAASLVLGLLGPPLAALPAIRRGVRLSVREAIEATGSAVGGQGALDRALRRVRFLPPAVQIGVRGVGRRKRRSFATVLQVALAVATLLAVLGLGTSVADTTRAAWTDHDWNVWVGSSLRRPFDARAERLLLATPGVAEAQPVLVNDVELAGEDAFTWGVPAQTFLRYRIAEGRWYTTAEERARAPVAVVERNIAHATGIRVGDTVQVATAAGAASFEVVGIAANQQENGTVLFVPLETLQATLGLTEGVNGYWVRTTSDAHDDIDRTTTRVEDALAAAGYEVGTEITYVGERDNVALNRNLTTTITVLGFLIVAISLVGLVNAITMSVLERTREIGILRCVGARARDVRRIFAAEGLVLAVAGWALGIPLGYLLDRFLVWLLTESLNVELPVAFPPANVPLALVGTVVLALLVLLLPLRRAVRFRPGDALRYA